MNLAFTFQLAGANLARSQLRTWLTIIGIVIGVTAVVLIIAIGNGLQASVESQLGALGADTMSITPGFSRAQAGFGGGGFGRGFPEAGRNQQTNLTTKDLQVIRLTPNVLVATGTISGRASIAFFNENASVQITGIEPATWGQFSPPEVAAGRLLSIGDTTAVVLGSRIANQYFKRPITLNTVLRIQNKAYRVVGILAESGGFGGYDNGVLMPLEQAREVLPDYPGTRLSSISVKAVDKTLVDSVVADLDYRLQFSRHVNNQTKDFTITAAQSIRQQISAVTASISLFLGGIAAISLLVGAIGIANTMFMAVLERTRQIGVMKALGATSSEVSRLFIIEAGILGLTGGAIGLALSFGLSLLLESLGVSLGLPTAGGRGGRTGAVIITPELAFFALAFSILIGMVAGYLPSRQAAKLRPVEALRYE